MINNGSVNAHTQHCLCKNVGGRKLWGMSHPLSTPLTLFFWTHNIPPPVSVSPCLSWLTCWGLDYTRRAVWVTQEAKLQQFQLRLLTGETTCEGCSTCFKCCCWLKTAFQPQCLDLAVDGEAVWILSKPSYHNTSTLILLSGYHKTYYSGQIPHMQSRKHDGALLTTSREPPLDNMQKSKTRKQCVQHLSETRTASSLLFCWMHSCALVVRIVR